MRRNGPANAIGHTLVFLRLMKCTLQRKHKRWLKKLLLVVAQRFHVEALPVHGDAHSAFVALASHTSSRENEVQPVV